MRAKEEKLVIVMRSMIEVIGTNNPGNVPSDQLSTLHLRTYLVGGLLAAVYNFEEFLEVTFDFSFRGWYVFRIFSTV